MKKILLSIVLFFLISTVLVPASTMAGSFSGPIVPQTCGQSLPQNTTPPDCSTTQSPSPYCPCGISDFFTMLVNIYKFIVYMIATPLAIIALTVGGIMIMLSAGSPDLMGKGKKILWAAIIGLVLVWGSWVIINTILCTILGYCAWHTL